MASFEDGEEDGEGDEGRGKKVVGDRVNSDLSGSKVNYRKEKMYLRLKKLTV